MNEQEVTIEIKKAAAMFIDGTYNADDLAARLMQIVHENNSDGVLHKKRLENLLYKVKTLLNDQYQYYHGDKTKLGICKSEEAALTLLVNNLLNQGYSIDAFGKKIDQQNLFK
jgi:hypothetical protein